MAIDIQQNTNIPKSTVIFSMNAELIAAVHLLANSAHHDFAKEWADLILKELSEESREFLRVISTMPFDGMGLFELLLYTMEFKDVEGFIKKIENYDDIEFASIVLEIDKEEIVKIKEKPSRLDQLIEERPWIEDENRKGVEYILFNSPSFRRGTIGLIKEVYSNQHFIDKINSLKATYNQSIDNINLQLTSQKPLELCQQLMGKTFRRVFDFKEFIFIPSYFLSPHRLRNFNEQSQLLIYDIRRDCLYLNEVGEKVSNTLKVISDRTRLEILRQLLIGSTYGKVLASRFDLTTATISHHLEQLRSVNLVQEEKVKNTKYFSVNKDELESLLKQLEDYLYNKL